MENTSKQPESLPRQYMQHLRVSLWWMFAPMAATLLAGTLYHQFGIPQIVTYAVGYGVWAVQFFVYCRRVWKQTAKEKQELQKRFDAEDAALFGAAKNSKKVTS